MENHSSSKDNIVKSRIIKAIIIILSISIPIVSFKYGVSFRPNFFGYLRRWLLKILILNLVIVLIFASPSLLHYLQCFFNYFKEGQKRYKQVSTTGVEDVSKVSKPPVTLSLMTRTSSLKGYFYQDWEDYVNDQTPTSLSSSLEREPIEEPWLDINEVASPRETINSFHLRERVKEAQSVKMVKKSGDTVYPLTFTTNEINAQHDNDDNTLESTWNKIKGQGENKLIVEKTNDRSDFDQDETLDDTWKAIMERGETVSSPSSLSLNVTERISVPSSLISPRVPRQDALAAWRELRKSETFTETVSVRHRAGLRRDPSVGLEDLNCRVESFIKKFNHQMLLQRQESEQRFMEMINSGG